jgi:hypothetical protein
MSGAKRKWLAFQIANGGQTTASTYHVVKKERISVEKVVVQVNRPF